MLTFCERFFNYLNSVTMYLSIYLILSILPVILTDCGCTLNRESGQCTSKQNNVVKYTKESDVNFKIRDMVLIQGNIFEMGTNEPVFPADYEGPARNKTVPSFYLDIHEVSNKKFLEFVTDTGYHTEAEKFGDSFIFDMFVHEKEISKYEAFRAVQAPWWIKMKEANWRQPEGPKSSIKG